MDELRYPVGAFAAPPGALSAAQRSAYIDVIERAPAALRAAVRGLGPEQLDTPYRPGGWTVRQVSHHVPDSHLNAYVRFCLALTEDEPTIKPYAEDRWAELKLSRTAPVEMSLDLLDLVHRRMVLVLREITPTGVDAPLAAPRARSRRPRLDARHVRVGTAVITWATSPRCASAWAGLDRSGRRARPRGSPRPAGPAPGAPRPGPHPRRGDVAAAARARPRPAPAGQARRRHPFRFRRQQGPEARPRRGPGPRRPGRTPS